MTTTVGRVEGVRFEIFDDTESLARSAAVNVAAALRDAVNEKGYANAMFATGNSQLEFLAWLVQDPHVEWDRVTAFHMDEYVGIASSHPASFQRYMRERVAGKVPVGAFHYLQGDTTDPVAEAERYAVLLREHPLDLCCLGIGENGHLAFNDPPVADFDDPLDVKVVELDAACRAQQVGEGHFPTVADVPTHAITVTIPALLRAAHVFAIVPDARKAVPVQAALEGPITTACPASALRRHHDVVLYLDRESASLLSV